MSKNRFIYNSIVMIFINIIVRIIGFSYEVILSKYIGPEGIGLFQIALTVLMVFLSITTSGIPISVTKLVAEEKSKKNYNNIKKIYNTTIILNLFISIIISIIIILFADFIAINIFKDREMIYGVYLLIPSVIIISITHILKSYFYGMKNMVIPSIAGIIESITRIIIIISILYYFRPKNPVYGAIIAIFGISIGELADFLWSFLMKKNITRNEPNENIYNFFSMKFLVKTLIMAFPLIISGFFSIILNFVNTILVPSRLIISGYTRKLAMKEFGRVMGMTMPLIHLPFMFTSAVVINLITSLSGDITFKRFNNIKSDIHLAIKITLLISIPLGTLFILLSKNISIFLYNDPKIGEYIRILGCGTVLSALQHTFSGILIGIGKQISVTRNRLIISVLRVILIYLLVGNPNFHIYGLFISFYFANILILILDFFTLKSTIDFKFDYIDILGKPLVGSIFMIGYIQISTYDLNNLHNLSILNLIFTLSIAFGSYILILIMTNALPKDIISRIAKNI